MDGVIKKMQMMESRIGNEEDEKKIFFQEKSRFKCNSSKRYNVKKLAQKKKKNSFHFKFNFPPPKFFSLPLFIIKKICKVWKKGKKK